MKQLLSAAIFVALACGLAACCSGDRTVLGEAEFAERAAEKRALLDRAESDLAPLTQALEQAAREGCVDILALSGGGSYASWAAGVVAGARENADPRFPRTFHLVTAISAGALSATHLFLGEDEDVAGISHALTTTEAGSIYHERSVFSLIFGAPALRRTDRLDELLVEFLPDALLRRVAESAGSRRLYVGTVDVDDGLLVVHDMVSLARAGDFEGYRRVIKASTAVPAFFDPVFLEGGRSLHVDGGVRAQLFLRALLVPSLDALRDEAAAGAAISIYTIANSGIGVRPEQVSDCLLPLARRAVLILLDESLIQCLADVYAVSEAIGANYRLSCIPPELVPTWSNTEFDPARMRELWEAGVAWGRAGRWLTEPPRSPFMISTAK